MTDKAKDLGMLIEVDGPTAQLLEFFQDHLGTWVSLTDLATYLDIPKTKVSQIINVLSQITRSLEIMTEDVHGEPHYQLMFHFLDGAVIPGTGGTTFSERAIEYVDREVEVKVPVEVQVPVPVAVPVPIGGALKKTSAKRATGQAPKTKTTASSKKSTTLRDSATRDGIVRWMASPGTPDPLDVFVVPPWFDQLKLAVDNGRHVGMYGPLGCGKSTAFEQLASQYGVTLANVPADGGLSRYDLTGYAEAKSGTSYFYAALFATAAHAGWWAKLDEANSAGSDTMMFLDGLLAPPYQMSLHGRTFPVHDDFICCVTFNKGLVGTRQLPQSLTDRMVLIHVGYPDKETLRRLLILHGADNDILLDKMDAYARAMWSTKIQFQLSPRRLYDALLYYIKGGLSLHDSVKEATMPYVWIPSEEATVKSVIDTFVPESFVIQVPETKGMEVVE